MSDEPRGSSIYIAFVPWVLFSIITQHASLAAGALAALAAAIVIALRSILAGRPKVLELATIASFAAFTVAGFVLAPASGDTLSLYARAIAAGLLALIAFASLLRTPSPSSTRGSRCRASSGRLPALSGSTASSRACGGWSSP